jgi:hypothetical protein
MIENIFKLDIEDHFLRLKEVFNCNVFFKMSTITNSSIAICIPNNISLETEVRIMDEIDSIKCRIESLYEIKTEYELYQPIYNKYYIFKFRDVYNILI